MKQEGKNNYGRKNFQKAIESYQECLEMLQQRIPNEHYNDKYLKKQISLFDQLSDCCLQIQNYIQVVNLTAETIKIITQHQLQRRNGKYSKILISSYLKQAQSYEQLKQLSLSKDSYLEVLKMETNNQQAVEGIERVSVPDRNQQSNPRQKSQKSKGFVFDNLDSQDEDTDEEKEAQQKTTESKEKVQVDMEWKKVYDQIIRIKEMGSSYIQKKQFQNAEQSLKIGIQLIQNNASEETLRSTIELRTAYVNMLQNLSLARFNVKKYKEAFQDSEQVLKFDPFNDKALYRKALSLKELNQDLEEAQISLKTLLTKDPANKEATILLKEIQLKIQSNEERKDQKMESDEEQQEEKKESQLTEQIQDQKVTQLKEELKSEPQKQQNIQSDKSNEVGQMNQVLQKAQSENQEPVQVETVSKEQIQKAIIQVSILNENQIPKTIQQFETAINKLKRDNLRMYSFLKQIPNENIQEIFKQSKINPDTFSSILSSFSQYTQEEDASFIATLLKQISTSQNFSLIKFMLQQTEKEMIKEVLSKLARREDVSDLRQIFLA